MSTTTPKSKFLFAFYSIKPAIAAFLEYHRQGQFVNQLPEVLQRVDQEIQKTLSTARNEGKEFRMNRFKLEDADTPLTPREFLIRLFGLRVEELTGRDGEVIPEALNDLIDDAEEAFLRHVLNDVNRNASSILDNGGAWKLRMSGILSTRTDKNGNFPLRKKRALFTIANYETELEAAKVPRFYCYRLESTDVEKLQQLYSELPDCVKDLFFSVSWRGQLRNDLPFYLTRDLLLFANNERWKALKDACEQGNRATANEACSDFLRDFLTYQRQENGFSLGAARKEKNVDKFSQRELSLLEFCRPANYIGQLWKTSPEAQAMQTGNDPSHSGEKKD